MASRKRIIALTFLALLSSVSGHTPAFAQDKPTARKIDEYSGDYRYGDESARLDHALNMELEKDPRARLHIIGYGLPGTARRRAMRAYDYYVDSRGVDPRRIVPVAGGYREEEAVELWIVPEGASAPVASPPTSVGWAAHVARKYDEFMLQGEWVAHQKESMLFAGLAGVLKAEPEARGYIVVYKGRGPRCEYCDYQGTELRFAKEQRRYLAREYQLDSSRIRIVDGGYAWSSIEVWIVPRGARPPAVRKNVRNPKR